MENRPCTCPVGQHHTVFLMPQKCQKKPLKIMFLLLKYCILIVEKAKKSEENKDSTFYHAEITSVNTFTWVLQGCLRSLCVFNSGEVMLSALTDTH